MKESAAKAFGTLVEMNGLSNTLQTVYSINEDLARTEEIFETWIEGQEDQDEARTKFRNFKIWARHQEQGITVTERKTK